MKPKTTAIDGKLVEIITDKEYAEKYKFYSDNPGILASTALEVEIDDKKYALPFRGKTSDAPGIIPDGAIYFVNLPENEKANYDEDNLEIVDYNDSKTIVDFLQRNEQIRKMESNILTDIDNIFCPQIGPDDSPEIKAFKEAIASKKCDINKYAPRFGDNYCNDRRILKGNSITMNKLVSMSKKLDIEVELILRNANNGDVPNPMDKEISVILTGEDVNND